MAYYLLNRDGSNAIECRDVDSQGNDRVRHAQLGATQYAFVSSMIDLIERNREFTGAFTIAMSQDLLSTYYVKHEGDDAPLGWDSVEGGAWSADDWSLNSPAKSKEA